MARKKAAPEPAGESCPMWMISYADLVTLLMSFFVVLYALKQGGPQHQVEVAAAIANRFGAETIPDSTDPVQLELMRIRGVLPKNAGMADQKAQAPDGHEPEVQTIRSGKDITSGGTINFEAGAVEIDKASMDTIHKIADILRGHNNVVVVKGHISANEVTMHPDDTDGMALSYRRAVAVTEALTTCGIERSVLRPTACGRFEPLKTQVYDDKAQRENRRVEVFTTDNMQSEFVPTQTVAPPEPTSSPAAPH